MLNIFRWRQYLLHTFPSRVNGKLAEMVLNHNSCCSNLIVVLRHIPYLDKRYGYDAIASVKLITN